MTRLRVLFVARPYSVHTARWINQVADEGWDLHLFPSSEATLHSDYRNLTTYFIQRDRGARLHESVRTRVLWPLSRGGHRLRALSHRLPSGWTDRAQWLAWVIRKTRPDIIHALEFQEAGYLIARTKPLFKPGTFPALAVSNWGSDIYLYGPLPEHTEKIRSLLACADYYTCECQRDVELARAYGFKGEVWPVLPVGGGFDIDNMRKFAQPGPTSARRVIALKGYQHWAGRGLVGLRALALSADALRSKGFRVAIYSMNSPDVRLAMQQTMTQTGLQFEEPRFETREDVLRLHGRARLSIGLSISDGLSTSALETLIMGSFPIQSNTSCLCELVQCGQGALMVPAEDPAEVAAAITRAALDDELVDRAAELNERVARERLSEEVIRPQVIAMYENAAQRSRAATAPELSNA
jgi:glycosyltransferase involved in cell wall biosynthesis